MIIYYYFLFSPWGVTWGQKTKGHRNGTELLQDCWEGSEARSHQTKGWRPLLKARPPPPPYSIGPYVL